MKVGQKVKVIDGKYRGCVGRIVQILLPHNNYNQSMALVGIPIHGAVEKFLLYIEHLTVIE